VQLHQHRTGAVPIAPISPADAALAAALLMYRQKLICIDVNVNIARAAAGAAISSAAHGATRGSLPWARILQRQSLHDHG
jgi:hypothetical protein